MSRSELISLFVIVVVGFSIRAPGVLWLKEVQPSANYGFHPDANRIIKITENFRDRPGLYGYVKGMATHLYLVRHLVDKFFGTEVDLAILVRLISLAYGLLTIILISLIARNWGFPTNVALLSSALLAISPLHVINSHFGTPDVSTTFYFYLSLFAGWGYVKTRQSLLFVLFVALIGTSLAMKFNISLLLPLFLVTWLHTEGRRVEKIVTAVFVMAGSFSFVSFFNYTPWHFHRFIQMLAFDNVRIVGGNNAAEQIGLYLWDTVSALGLGNWIFFFIGFVFLLNRWTRSAVAELEVNSWGSLFKKVLKSPEMVFFSAFLARGILLISAEIHAIRHLIVFIPIACLISANGFWKLLRLSQCPRIVTTIVLSLLIAYQCYTVINLERIYTNDIRNKMADWINANVRNGEKVGAFSDYARVKGVQLITGNEANTSELDLDYFVTCDLEYSRYFKYTDAKKIFHAFGGQERLDFYRDLFSGRLKYDIVADFVWRPASLEQWLVEKGVIRDLDTYTPQRCLIFSRVGSIVNKFGD